MSKQSENRRVYPCPSTGSGSGSGGHATGSGSGGGTDELLTSTVMDVLPRLEPSSRNAHVSRSWVPFEQAAVCVSQSTDHSLFGFMTRSSPTDSPPHAYTAIQPVSAGACTRTGVTPLTIAPCVGATYTTVEGGSEVVTTSCGRASASRDTRCRVSAEPPLRRNLWTPSRVTHGVTSHSTQVPCASAPLL